MDDERRHPHASAARCGRRSRRSSASAPPPRPGSRPCADSVAHQSRNSGSAASARRALLEADRPAPVLEDLAGRSVRAPRASAPTDSRGPRAPLGVRADHDQRARLLGVGGGEQAAHRPAFGHAEQRGALASPPRPSPRARRPCAASSVGSSVTRSDRPVPRLSNRISRENDAEPAQEARERRLRPEVLEVRDPSHHEDEIERTVADAPDTRC